MLKYMKKKIEKPTLWSFQVCRAFNHKENPCIPLFSIKFILFILFVVLSFLSSIIIIILVYSPVCIMPVLMEICELRRMRQIDEKRKPLWWCFNSNNECNICSVWFWKQLAWLILSSSHFVNSVLLTSLQEEGLCCSLS